MRHGRKSSSKPSMASKSTFPGLGQHRDARVVSAPANAPEHEAVELLAETLEQAPGLFQLDIDLGYMASHGWRNGPPRRAYHCPPLPQGGPLHQNAFTLDFVHGR